MAAVRNRWRPWVQFGQFLLLMALAAAVMVVGGYVALWFAREGQSTLGMAFGLVALFGAVALVNEAGDKW